MQSRVGVISFGQYILKKVFSICFKNAMIIYQVFFACRIFETVDILRRGRSDAVRKVNMKKKRKIQHSGKLKSYMQWPAIVAALLILMDVAVFAVNVRAGFVVAGFTVFYLILLVVLHFAYHPYILKNMISFASQYAQIQKGMLKGFVIPYALLDTDGKVLWMNDAFCDAVGKDAAYKKYITNLFPEIDAKALPRKKDETSVEVSCNGRDYRAQMQKIFMETLEDGVSIVDVPQESNYLIALYLFDTTELNYYIRENQEQKMVAGLIYLDNYEEALESIEEVRRSMLVALIDRKISKYVSNLGGITKKLEKDKYFVSFNYKSLQELQANRFSLLEEVKTVNIGNEMNVTLSIGIGVNGSNYGQNSDFSRTAIELALGRGGDQAVVKDNDKISYYGGKSQQMEKNTRVKARVKAHALRELMGSRDRVIIMGHKLADIDVLGAAVGVWRAARIMDKKAHIVLGDINGSIRPWVNTFVNDTEYPEYMFITPEEAKQLVDENTMVVVVDTNRPSMTECVELLNQTKTIVVFDHHRQSSEIIKNAVLSYIEPYASSACEMIAEILQYFADEIRLRNKEADCVYAGMIIDTNNFTAKTGVRTFEAAAFLRRCGADVTRVRKMLRSDMDSYKARAEAVRHAEIYLQNYAISTCPSENLESPTVTGAQVANELLNIVGVKASFVLTDYRERIYISARAIDEVNVQIIMERLGGGGHLNIAGAQIDGATLEEAKAKLKDTIKNMIEEGAI